MARMIRTRTTRDTSDYAPEPEKEETESRPRRSRGVASDDSGSRVRGRGDTAVAKKRTGPKGSGWAGYKTIKENTKSSDFPDNFKPSEEKKLVKFLEDEPLVTYEQHWVQEIHEGKRSFACLGDDNCPLDEYGHRTRSMSVFNLVDMSEEDPKVKTLTCGPMLAEILFNHSVDPQTGPLTKGYWALASKTDNSKKGNKTTYTVLPVKERDVLDDWGVDPLSPEELSSFEDDLFEEEDVLHFDSVSDLRAIAEQYLG
jgi:hypothetical protein